MASLATNMSVEEALERRRTTAPPAPLTMGLVESYQTPDESYPDTPEPWSTMAGGSHSESAPPKAPVAAPDFGLLQPSHVILAQAQQPARRSRLLAPEERRSGVAVALASTAKSKLLTVRNTFIDVGLPSPTMPQQRQAHSCPGSRLVTPQSCKSGRLLSPLHDLSAESSAVSTVDTEEAAHPNVNQELDTGCEQLSEQLAAPHVQVYDVSVHSYEQPRDIAAQVYGVPPACPTHHVQYDIVVPPAQGLPFGSMMPLSQAFGDAAGRTGYEVLSHAQPFEQHPQQPHFLCSEASYGGSQPQFAHPSQQPWHSEPLPTLLTTAQSHHAPAPMKPILQLDKVLPVWSNSQPESAPRMLGSPEVPTVGSAGHGVGECKPCAFYWKPEGCGNGVHCSFCHLCDSGEKKRRAKEKRVAVRMAKANGFMM